MSDTSSPKSLEELASRSRQLTGRESPPPAEQEDAVTLHRVPFVLQVPLEETRQRFSREQFAALLELATTTLAELAFSEDLDRNVMRRKAARVYDEIRAVWHGPGPDDMPE